MCLKTLEIYLEIYELDTTYFVSAPGLAWHVCLKKTGEKLELITGCDMLLMIEKGLGVEFIKQDIRMLKQIICMDGQCLKRCL